MALLAEEQRFGIEIISKAYRVGRDQILMRFGIKIIVHVIVACITALIVWHLWNGGRHESRADNSPKSDQAITAAYEDDTASTDEGWKLSQSTDPMTDERIVAAETNFINPSGNNVRLFIECKSERYLTYRFTAFKSDGNPTAFYTTFGSNRFDKIGQVVNFSVRIDSGNGEFVITQLQSSITRYLNEFIYTADLHDPAREVIEKYRLQGIERPWKTMAIMAEAPALRFQVPFPSGAEVLYVFQTTHTNVRSVLDSCL